MIVQLSSGQGPAECELAVAKLLEALTEECPDLKVLSAREGKKRGTFSSVMFSLECSLPFPEGSVQWICRSPYRPEHKRKNWFVDVSILPEKNQVCLDGEIRFERFHCGGKGGQNVNKVETGVRLIHLPTQTVVTSVEERSQFLNKKRAMEKLEAKLWKLEQEAGKQQAKEAWREHERIVRGEPVRVYEGAGFKRKG